MTRGRVLLVCYHFPPVGGPAVGRPLALFKYLPRLGYHCDVLTVKPVAHRVWEPELLDGLDTSSVFRAGSHDPQRLMYLLGMRKMRDAFVHGGSPVSSRFFPDSQVGWIRPAIRLGRTLASNRHYDVILSTSPPVSNHLVARQLSIELKAPWVADFRDFWTRLKAEDQYAKRRQIDKACSLLKSIRDQAALVTAASPSIAAYVKADTVVYNSFDDDLVQLWQPPQTVNQFVIGILGTLNDICPIRPLLELLAIMRQREPDLHERMRLVQVGRTDESWLLNQLQEFDLADRCEVHLFQKREETIRILSASALLYLALGSETDSGVIPGRLYTLL
ncbi:MAG: hypothetical protein AB1744_03215, partial [Candidatus Zixiibacteriota bacterium]